MTKKSLLIGFVLAVVSAPTSSALAQTQVIVPFPPGGGLDSVIRVMTQKIQEQTKEVFIVDNRPGANGMIGTRVAAKAKPDGKTWLAVDGAVMTVNPILYQGTSSFDSFRDLKVVAAVGFQPSILVVNPAFGANTIKEFVELARKRDIFYASGGIGSAGHLTMEYFASVAGLKLTHIPYKGGAPAINDLLGGQIPVAFVSLPNALPHVRTGKLIDPALMYLNKRQSPPDREHGNDRHEIAVARCAA